MANDQITPLPVLIPDKAGTVDFFGSHKRVAQSIAHVISGNKLLGVIGVLGPWGSGKSTALKLLEEPLKKTAPGIDWHIFIYDAWLHHSDPPRRSFLESLINFLSDGKTNLTRRDDWRDELDKLRRRLEENESTTTSLLTSSGKILAISLLLWPIGLNFADKDWIGSTFVGIDIFALSIAILTAPFIIVPTIFLYWRPFNSPFDWRFWRKSNWQRHRSPYQNDSVLSLLMNKTSNRALNRTVRTPDPTALEFHDTYHRVMQQVSAPNRRFVFVVDNLDRIPEAEAVTLWATVRSFFLGRSEEAFDDADQFAAPVVILPLDDSAIRRMYGRQASGQTDADELAQAFLDKTFDVVFRVPPPVISDWQSFLGEKLRESFGAQLDDKSIFLVTRLVQTYLDKSAEATKQQPVTPRYLIKVVNSLVTLFVDRGKDIPFPSIAYYAINGKDIQDDILKLMEDTTPKYIENFDKEWKTSVAAIYYGAPVNKALQLAIATEMQLAITEFHKNEFVRFASITGADLVLEQVITAGTTGNDVDPKLITNAAALVTEVTWPTPARIESIMDRLRTALETTHAAWASFEDQTPAGLAALVDSAPDNQAKEFCEALVSNLKNASPAVVEIDATKLASEDGPKKWIAAARAVVNAAKAKGVTIGKVEVAGAAPFFLGVALNVDEGDEFGKLLVQASAPEDVVRQLTDIATPLNYDTSIVKIVGNLLRTRENWEWQPFVGATGLYVQNQPPNNRRTANALAVLCRLSAAKGSPSKGELVRLCREGHLFDKLTRAHGKGQKIAEAAIIGTLILFDPSLEMVATPEQAQAGHDLIENMEATLADRADLVTQIDTFLSRFGEFRQLVDAAGANKGIRILARKIVGARLNNASLGDVSPTDAVARLPSYLDIVDEESRDNFWRVLPECPGFWEALEAAPLDDNTFTIYQKLTAGDDPVRGQAKDLFVKQVRQMTVEKWVNALRSSLEPVPLVRALCRDGHAGLDFGEPLSQAIKTLAYEALDGTTVAHDIMSDWFVLAQALSQGNRRTLFKNVRDRIFSDPPGSFAVLRAGGAALLGEGDFGSEPDSSTRHVVAPLVEPDPERLDWLKSHASDVTAWVRGADNHTRDYIRERLQELINSDDDASAADAWRLGEMWAMRSTLNQPAPKASDSEVADDTQGSEPRG